MQLNIEELVTDKATLVTLIKSLETAIDYVFIEPTSRVFGKKLFVWEKGAIKGIEDV